MMKVVTKSSNLNIRKGPGTQYEIPGDAIISACIGAIAVALNNSR
jgi:uncharacterized protein YraI